ncbi:MAG TPA: PQQ-binding-like beta-propeller repeat protein [Streptosporangiaceae bacterium]
MEALAAGDPRQVGVYRLRARLGAGGMGQVFLGYSPAGRAVAVKVIHRELARDPEFRTRFRREVAAASAVSGAYTAPVVAAGPDDDPPWLATVFVPGPSLAEAAGAAGSLPTASVWRLAGGLVEALQAVHSCGLVHRDLKPANVLLALDGPRVIDFGISRALEKTAMTSTGMIVGTPSFMSPEQAEDARVGPPSDVFSLGCVIVFAATGTGPFGQGPQASLLYRVVHSAPAITEVPGGLRELAKGCLAKVPADRPGLAALEAAIAAGRVPGDDDELASFWSLPVTRLIRAHELRLIMELREGPTGPAPAGDRAAVARLAAGKVARVSGTVAAATAPRTAAAGGPAPGAAGSALAGTVPAETTRAGTPPTELAAGRVPTRAGPAGGRPAETVPAETVSAGTVPAEVAAKTQRDTAPATGADREPGDRGPALPADQVLATGPGPTVPWVTRRRVLLGLAAVTGAGLGGAAWALSQGAAHSPGSHRPGPAATLSHPASRPRATRSTSASASPGPPASPGAPAELWSFSTGGMVTALAWSGGIVFAGSTDDRVYALRASDGRRLWTFATRAPVQSKIAAAGGRVYAGSNDASVYALRASDGARLWTFPAGGTVQSSIVLAGPSVYLGSGDETVYALRARDGARLWGTALGGGATGIAVAGGTVIVGADDNAVHALRASDGHRIWDFPTGAGGATGVAVAGGVAFVGSGDGHLCALRVRDGRKLWDASAGGAVESGVAVAAGLVYLGSNASTVLALRATDGTRAWQASTDGPVTSGLAVSHGIVYAGGNDYTVRAVRASDGIQIWRFTAGGPVASQIAVADGTAYVGSNDFRVYALK